MGAMNKIIMLLKKLLKLLNKDKAEEPILSNDDFEIIDPERTTISYQIISPRKYEFSVEELKSVLGTDDYIYLPQFADEQYSGEGG